MKRFSFTIQNDGWKATKMTSKRKNSKRLYYPTGLISLILLPTLCIWYLNTHHAFDQDGTIEIAWWSPSLHTTYPNFFSKESHPNKKYSDINLTGIDKDDKIKLDYAQLQIRELVKSQDTSTGVHFHFGNKSKYWELIKAVDICRVEDAKIYIAYNNDIWVFIPKPFNPKREKIELIACGGIPMHDVMYVKEESEEEVAKEKAERRKEEIKFITEAAKTYFLPGLLFIIMILLTAKRIYKNQIEEFHETI